MQIGHQGKGTGSNDTENLGAPANMIVDAPANELYVADGYVNHRVIVFDATTGAYKRHWGAYGKRPDDGYFTTARGEAARAVQRRRAEREPAEPVRSERPAGAAVPNRARRAHFERRSGLRLRPHERPSAGVPEKWHVRARGGDCQGHVRQRIGVGRRLLDRSRADSFSTSTTGRTS